MTEKNIGYEGSVSPTQNDPMDDPSKGEPIQMNPERESFPRVRTNGRPGRPRQKTPSPRERQ